MIKFRKAYENEIEAIAQIYEAVKGQKGCVWDEDYPNIDDARADYEFGGLYVSEADGELISAVTVLHENELDELECWKVKENAREIARVCVAPAHQGHGYAYETIKILFSELAENGWPAVHLLVAKENPSAVNTYKKLGFGFLGECFMFGHDYYMCELIL